MHIKGSDLRKIIKEELDALFEVEAADEKEDDVMPHGYDAGHTSRPETTAEEEPHADLDVAQKQALHLDAEDETLEDQEDEDAMSYIPESWRRIARI